MGFAGNVGRLEPGQIRCHEMVLDAGYLAELAQGYVDVQVRRAQDGREKIDDGALAEHAAVGERVHAGLDVDVEHRVPRALAQEMVDEIPRDAGG